MTICAFCESNIPPGTGKVFVSAKGKIESFCSSKCEKNKLKLKRKARLVNWVRKKKKISQQ